MPALTSIALAALGVGTAVSAGAQIFEGVEAEKESRRVAAETRRRGQAQAAATRERGQAQASRARAAAGASGLAGPGSLLNVMATIFEATEQSREITTSADISAANIRRQGRAARTAGVVGGLGTLFTGFGQAAFLGADAGIFGGGAGRPTAIPGSTGTIFETGAPAPTLGFSQGF